MHSFLFLFINYWKCGLFFTILKTRTYSTISHWIYRNTLHCKFFEVHFKKKNVKYRSIYTWCWLGSQNMRLFVALNKICFELWKWWKNYDISSDISIFFLHNVLYDRYVDSIIIISLIFVFIRHICEQSS